MLNNNRPVRGAAAVENDKYDNISEHAKEELTMD